MKDRARPRNGWVDACYGLERRLRLSELLKFQGVSAGTRRAALGSRGTIVVRMTSSEPHSGPDFLKNDCSRSSRKQAIFLGNNILGISNSFF